ncbi:hypothetical protein [Anabaena azotica]|uniref:Uncharacterized protein n=1 Tax=Anabaena azotica FACHB-119 TaxID=947527 RepID=A0ABR8D751_9NOST|nr:hypothetical protein [Anabaena azotica]MBD2501578.1 hypothetical protein [Anabaena azotica FACHB-119]
MTKITIYPEYMRQFGKAQGSTFCLVTNSRLINQFILHKGNKYKNYKIISYDPEDNFTEIIRNQTPEMSHILVIAPDCYFRSPDPLELGNYRKLCVMPCNSTPTSVEAINHFLHSAKRINPYEHEKVAEQLFINFAEATQIKFIDEQYKTVCEFQHLNDYLQWHEQIGELNWGEQQLFPAGEISVLPVELFALNLNSRLEMNGELALKGIPIVHSGICSFLPEDQARIFQDLSKIQEHAVIVSLYKGFITKIEASHPDAKLAADMLNAMCEVDSRYRVIVEIGFSINNTFKLFPENCAMNEVYAATTNGTVHFGIGLIPHTQYHVDIICPFIKVLGKNEQLIFGGMIS